MDNCVDDVGFDLTDFGDCGSEYGGEGLCDFGFVSEGWYCHMLR